jgi:hypothetical protein
MIFLHQRRARTPLSRCRRITARLRAPSCLSVTHQTPAARSAVARLASGTFANDLRFVGRRSDYRQALLNADLTPRARDLTVAAVQCDAPLDDDVPPAPSVGVHVSIDAQTYAARQYDLDRAGTVFKACAFVRRLGRWRRQHGGAVVIRPTDHTDRNEHCSFGTRRVAAAAYHANRQL